MRYSTPRLIYPWKSRPVGRRALCLLAIYVERYASFDELRADPAFRRRGITATGALDFLRKWCPAIFDDWDEVFFDTETYRELDESAVSGRLHNLFTQGAREHPRLHPALRDLFLQVETEWKTRKEAV
jgi:hypothetical protein